MTATALLSAFVARHDEPDYLDFAGVAEMTGLSASTVSWRHRTGQFPDPDIVLERTPGWRPRTVRAWLLDRLQQKAPGLELVSPDGPDKNPPPRYLDASECAEMAGVKRNTWDFYWRKAKTAPPPDITLGRSGGWLFETVQEWVANRPGAGYRSDIHGGDQ